MSVNQSTRIQRRYYTSTATHYDQMHAKEGIEDPANREVSLAILRMLNVRSVLDVGSATGRGLLEFVAALPGALVCGVEPVAALLEQGIAAGVNKSVPLLRAAGEALPFANESFDAVCEFGILHHVPNPSAIVREMLRVARKVVVIADSNRFGQGSRAARLLKLALYKMRLWNAFNFVRTRGKHYQISEGDGLFYSYSVYDSYDVVAQWADRVLLVPNGTSRATSWLHPLLDSEGVILIGIRNALQHSRTDREA